MGQVPEEEARRNLIAKMPEAYQKKILKASYRLGRYNRRVSTSGVPGMPASALIETIKRECKMVPTNIEDLHGGNFVVSIPGHANESDMLLTQGRVIRSNTGGAVGKFRVELLPTELNCDQIFDFVQNELNINEEHRRNVIYAYLR